MSTAAHPAVESRKAAATRVAAAFLTETGLARLAFAVGAVHVVDDNFLQPQPGTSAGDHLVGGLIQTGLFVLFAVTLSLNIIALRVVRKYREKYD